MTYPAGRNLRAGNSRFFRRISPSLGGNPGHILFRKRISDLQEDKGIEMFHIISEVYESVTQLTGMWGKLLRDVGCPVADEDGFAIRWADAKFAFYNALVVTDPVDDEEQLRRLFLRSAEFMDGREQPGCVWLFEDLVSPDARSKINDLALDAGLVSSFTCWGMAGDLSSLGEPSHPALRFERVTTAQHLDIYASLNARAYGLSETDAMATLVRACGATRYSLMLHMRVLAPSPVQARAR